MVSELSVYLKSAIANVAATFGFPTEIYFFHCNGIEGLPQ